MINQTRKSPVQLTARTGGNIEWWTLGVRQKEHLEQAKR